MPRLLERVVGRIEDRRDARMHLHRDVDNPLKQVGYQGREFDSRDANELRKKKIYNVAHSSTERPTSDPVTRDSILEKKLTTQDGLTLTLGKNGEVLATIQNSENRIGLAHLRHSGAVVTEKYWVTLHEVRAGTNTKTIAIDDPQTYSCRITHHADGATTLNVNMDPSLKALKVYAGNKEYLISAAEVAELRATARLNPPTRTVAVPGTTAAVLPGADQASKSSAGSVPPTAAPTATNTSVPNKASVATPVPVMRVPPRGLAAVEAGTALAAAHERGALKALSHQASETRALIADGRSLKAPTLRTATVNTPITQEPTTALSKPQASAAASENGLSKRPPTRGFTTALKSSSAPQSEVKPARIGLSSSQASAEPQASKAAPKGATVEHKATLTAEQIESIKQRFVKIADSYQKWVSDGLENSQDAQTFRNRAEKLGRQAGLSEQLISKILEGKAIEFSSRGSSAAVASETASPKSNPKPANRSAPAAASANSTALSIPESQPTAQIDLQAQQNQLKAAHETWKQKLSASEWAKNNPLKAVTLAAAASEAVLGPLKADYRPGSSHSPIPGILSWFNRDLEAAYSFTTAEGGLTKAIAAQAFSNAGNIALMTVTFAGGDRILQGVGLAKVASAAAPVLTVVGPAVHGYFTFSEGQFASMNDRQLAANVSSPIVTGAIFGAPLGPVGSGAGAVAGAAGEAVGVTRGYYKIQEDIQNDWWKKEVREALQNYTNGWVYPEDHPTVSGRRARSLDQLHPQHQEALRTVAQRMMLDHVFSEFTAGERTELGFMERPTLSTNNNELGRVDQHNWERVVQLSEGRKMFGGSYLNDVQSQVVAQKFESEYVKRLELIKEAYDRAHRVRYNFDDNKIKVTHTIEGYCKTLIDSIPSTDNDSELLNHLTKAFPELNTILSRPLAKEELIVRLDGLGEAKHGPNRFRKLLDLASTTFEPTRVSPTGTHPSRGQLLGATATEESAASSTALETMTALVE